MALVKLGGGIIQISGSIGGNTFARNRSGNYMRARTKPINPNSARQIAVRAALASLTTRWAQTLTAVQRTAWNLYASNVNMLNRLGETINLTGFNHFIRSNSALQRMAMTIIDDGPTTFEIPAQDPAFGIAGSEATQIIDITFDPNMDWVSEDGAVMWVYHGQPQNAQRNFFAGPWRLSGVKLGDSGTPLISPQSTAAVFAITEGQRIWSYARISRADGRLSQPFRADIAVSA